MLGLGRWLYPRLGGFYFEMLSTYLLMLLFWLLVGEIFAGNTFLTGRSRFAGFYSEPASSSSMIGPLSYPFCLQLVMIVSVHSERHPLLQFRQLNIIFKMEKVERPPSPIPSQILWYFWLSWWHNHFSSTLLTLRESPLNLKTWFRALSPTIILYPPFSFSSSGVYILITYSLLLSKAKVSWISLSGILYTSLLSRPIL